MELLTIQWISVLVLVSSLLSRSILGLCPVPRPAFPVPSIRREAPEIKVATSRLHKALQEFGVHLNDDTVFSVHVSTSETDLFSYHHMLEEDQELWNGHLLHYRIGALTKIVTALAIERAVVHDRILEIDDPVVRYIPELKDSTCPHSWENISIRSIINFEINMPIEPFLEDLASSSNPLDLGLPPLSHAIPDCGVLVNFNRTCRTSDLLALFANRRETFSPKYSASASDTTFDLLGLVVSRATQMTLEQYVNATVLSRLGMNDSTFDAPKTTPHYQSQKGLWGRQLGVSNPSNGIYSTSADLVKMLQYIAKRPPSTIDLRWHKLLTADYLEYTTRPIEIDALSGHVAGFASKIILMPEYGIEVVLLVSEARPQHSLEQIEDLVVATTVRAADRLVQTDLGKRYTGYFEIAAPRDHHVVMNSDRLDTWQSPNSSVVISHSLPGSLQVHGWISNGRDMLAVLASLYGFRSGDSYIAHLVFSGRYMNEHQKSGERWFIEPRSRDSNGGHNSGSGSKIHELVCDMFGYKFHYGGRAINEMIFWHTGDRNNGRVYAVELPAFDITLLRGRRPGVAGRN